MSANPSRQHCVTSFIILLFPVLLILLAPVSAVQAAAGDIQVSYQDQLLTLKAQEVDIKTILLRISDETGVFVRFPKTIEKQVSVELTDTPLAKALKKLLRGLNHAIIYTSFKKNQGARVAQVHVFKEAKGGSARTYSSSNSSSSGNRGQAIVARRIENYEKRIESLNARLSRLDADSPQAKRYTRQIQSYQRTLERLREQMR